jgi:hypothetical protein
MIPGASGVRAVMPNIPVNPVPDRYSLAELQAVAGQLARRL